MHKDPVIQRMIDVIKEKIPDYDPEMDIDLEVTYNKVMNGQFKDEKALRYNEGKLEWSLVHFKSLEPMIKVLMYGTKKYSRDNWKKGLDRTQILESMMRHLVALMDGELIDPESNELHIGHIMCNAMFWQYFNGKGDKELEEALIKLRTTPSEFR